jgi:hypothetical protein
MSLGAVIALALLVAGTPDYSLPSAEAVSDIPVRYLAAYQGATNRFGLGADGWSYLAAIGKVETDHGRLRAPGVASGQNAHGCCAGPMQIHNGFGSGGGTWGRFKIDGDGDGRTDIHDPDDAIATAARYVRASGAPVDWRRAVFAYNHADWYVARVLRQAAEYRGAAQRVAAPSPVVGDWLAPVPGFTGQRCDRRIVPDVLALARAYRLTVTACFGGAPHELRGEHPLGLAIDAVPADGDWSHTAALARAFGWLPACASAGCPGRGPFRVLLYNGYPGHGDPAHTRTPHIHLSWHHAPARPFTQAPWVRLLTASPAGAR